MSSTKDTAYLFAVEDAEGKSFRLDIRPYDEQARPHFQSVWKRLYGALAAHHKECQRQGPEWLTWAPWDWCEEKKPGFERRVKYVAWCGNLPIGFLNVWSGVPSAHVAGQNVVYIEHIAASPGNQMTELWNRRFKGIGSALFAYASLLSQIDGCSALGLHVADAVAEKFYRAIQHECARHGIELFQPDLRGIAGPTPRGDGDKAKLYLETTQAGARHWLSEYRP